MTGYKEGEQWAVLSQEYKDTQQADFRARAVCYEKGNALFKGTSHTGASDDEISKSEEAWQAWQDVIVRMTEFVKNNT